MTVTAILSRKGYDTVSIEPSTLVREAVRELAERKIGALVVLGAGHRVAGIISERDIVKALAKHGEAVLDQPVSQIMTRKVVTCGENDTIVSIMELMTSNKFRHVPVVRANRLIGIISIGDVVKHRLRGIESEAAALRDYIQTG